MKALILFYSYSGNTRQIADIIQRQTGANMADIEVVRPYPADYNACVKQAEEEVKKGFEPKIKPLAVNIDDFDTIFIGTPVWWYTFSPPVRTALSAWCWEGKTVYPFATHGGGIGSTFRDYQSFCSGATVKPLLEVYFRGISHERTEAEIKAWIEGA